MNQKRFFTDWRIGLIGVFVLAILIYLPTLHGVAIWDDDSLIVGSQFGGNNFYSAFTHPFGSYFRPLTSASFVLDSSIAAAFHAPGVPIFYHQTNMLLHALTAVLVSVLAFLISDKKLAGILAGVFFALQPMQVSAVAWIGGRTDALSAMFTAAFLVTLVLYCRGGKVGWMVASAICYFLAATAKEQVAAMIPVVPFAFVWIGNRKWKESLRASAWFLIPVFLYTAYYILEGPTPHKVSNGFVATVLNSLRTDAFYGFAFLVPNRSSLITYTLQNYTGLEWLLLGIALVVAFFLLFRFAVKRHPKIAWLVLGGVMLYLPVCNFPTLPSMVVASYRLANTGVLVACLFGILATYFLTNKRYLLAGIVGLNLAAGTVVTWWGVHQWMTVKGFFGVVAKNDYHFLVGVLDYSQAVDKDGDHAEAIRLTDQTISWFFERSQWLDLLEKERMAAITPDIHRKLQANYGRPLLQTLGNFLGQNAYFLARDKQIERARRVAAMAQMLAPGDAWVQYLYGRLIYPIDKQAAIRDWKIAFKINPDFADCAISLGRESMLNRKFEEAAAYFKQATRNIPYNGEVWVMFANAKLSENQRDGVADALDHAEKAMFPGDKTEIANLRRRLLKTPDSGSNAVPLSTK